MDIQTSLVLCKEYVYAMRADTTAMAYTHGLNHFQEFLIENGLKPTSPQSAITMEYFIRFPTWLAINGYAKQTLGVYIAAIKFLLDWMVIEGVIEPTYSEMLRYDKARSAVSKKREALLPRFPKRDDVQKMLDAARLLSYKSPMVERNIAIVEFLASSGARNSEICKLLVGDLNSETKSTIVLGKASKERRVFYSEVAKEAIRYYWEIRGYQEKTHPVFTRHDKGVGKRIKPLTTTSIRNIVNEIAILAGVDVFTPHYFRHAFAIKMLSETGNLALVQDLLGHVSPTATRVYAKIYPDDLQAAHHKVFN